MPRTLRRPGPFARAACAGLIGALLLFATGCGGTDEKFTSGEADRALAALDAVQEYVDEGRCSAAARRVQALAVQSTRINNERPDLGEPYASSVARLQTLVERECVEIAPASPTPETAATGATGEDEPTAPVEPTGGGTDVPATPDNGTDGNNTGGGDTGGDQSPAPDNSPPADSGGAGPGA
ncbi:MAG: hypothetical protein ACSLFF_08970 [Solirubrobacterales bacterium]